MNHPAYYVEEGVHVPLAHEIKKLVTIPVIAVGRIINPLHAEEILKAGQADFVTMGRALISDPFLPEKAFKGQFDDITPCISCNRCIKSIRQGSLACTVNPEVGKEGERPAGKAASPKRVLVIGDAKAPREIIDAVSEGYEVGATI
jgi:tRNA-dihydrouridine synthase